MANLTEEEIGRIVRRARMFQKFYGVSGYNSSSNFESEYPDVYEITDSLNLNRASVTEAILEFRGIPVEEPFILDAGFNNAKVLGFANGNVDTETLKELKAQIEYHFDISGEIKHRKNKTIWQAKPNGFSRMLASRNSLEVSFDQTATSIRIQANQSMKTVNKFYAPAAIGVLVAIVFLGASMFGRMNDEVLGVIMAVIFGFGSFLYSRFMKGRKQKRKNKLVDLVERLQQIVERRRKAGSVTEKRISISEEYNTLEEIELHSPDKTKA